MTSIALSLCFSFSEAFFPRDVTLIIFVLLTDFIIHFRAWNFFNAAPILREYGIGATTGLPDVINYFFLDDLSLIKYDLFSFLYYANLISIGPTFNIFRR